MRYGFAIIFCVLLSACSITHHTVYLRAWDDNPLIDGRNKIYRVKMDLPRNFKFWSIASAEFNVEYDFFCPYDSSTVFVSNIEPGLETMLPNYYKKEKREYTDKGNYAVEYRYCHISYGYRNVSFANKGKMDSLINNVKIDSLWTRVNKGSVYQKTQERKVITKAKKRSLHYD